MSMELNVEKCAEHGAILRKIVNTDIDEALKEIAAILNNVEENQKVDEMLEVLGKMETAYNEEYFPKFKEEEKVLLEQIPELEAKINSISVDALKVGSSDAKIAQIDADEVGIV